MLISEEDTLKRLNNPLNLMQRMKNGLSAPEKRGAMDLFMRSRSETIEVIEPVLVKEVTSTAIIPFKNPFASSPKQNTQSSTDTPPSVDDLITDSDSAVKLALAHDTALELLTTGLGRLNIGVKSGNIEDKKLPHILTTTSKIITDIRKERLEREKINKGDQNVHFHFYCPEQRKIDTYDIIEVNG